jgi:hypothetical protein
MDDAMMTGWLAADSLTKAHNAVDRIVPPTVILFKNTEVEGAVAVVQLHASFLECLVSVYNPKSE